MNIVGPDIMRGKIRVDSEEYFNKPKKMEEMKQYSDVMPVDIFGAFVPEDKSDSNLKKTEAQIQKRFGLKKEEGGE